MRHFSVGLVLLLLAMLVGCKGGENAKNEAAKSSAKQGENTQTVTLTEKGGKTTVVSDGKTVRVTTADGKEVKVDVEKAKALGEMAAKVQGKAAGAKEEEASENSSESADAESADKNVMQITSGDSTVTLGESEVPKEFPLSVYEKATVTYNAHMKQAEDEVWQVHLTSSAAPADVAAFYEKALKDKGMEVKRMEQKMPGQIMILLTGEAGKDSGHVQVMSEAKESNVVILWTRKTGE